ncbi:MAG: aspartyl protease [Planctomycetes bacterium]|nr:aspartyl protease [Planctomycetota bacterium]
MPSVVEPKPGVDMGRVLVTVTVENADDRKRASAGAIPPEAVRRVAVGCLVDSGATFLCLPESLVEQLGLDFHRVREARTVSGPMSLKVYGGAIIEVQGRSCHAEVMALPEGRQPLLGQIPLETLDWWIDTKNHRLVGNPEHGGEWMADIF